MIAYKVPTKEEYDAIQVKWQLYDDMCTVLNTTEPDKAVKKLLEENKSLKERIEKLKAYNGN